MRISNFKNYHYREINNICAFYTNLVLYLLNIPSSLLLTDILKLPHMRITLIPNIHLICPNMVLMNKDNINILIFIFNIMLIRSCITLSKSNTCKLNELRGWSSKSNNTIINEIFDVLKINIRLYPQLANTKLTLIA